MCGIVGCIGVSNAKEVLLNGLSRLEYRGYDSAGVALVNNGDVIINKCQGKVGQLADSVKNVANTSTTGIGHTRWATHGVPSDVNAHPHQGHNKRFSLVHNGIIENHAALRERLEDQGINFTSQTDSEVLVCLIESIAAMSAVSGEEAVRLALNEVVGAYAIVVLDSEDPDQLVVARKSSPLVIGVSKDAYYVASDATPIVAYTKEVIYLEDNHMAVLAASKPPVIFSIDKATPKPPYIENLEMDLQSLEKAGYEHFMLKEIHEQPTSIADSLRGRLSGERALIKLGGIEQYENRMASARRIIIVACGTSWHAGLVAEYAFEQLAGISVEVEYASEFRYRQPIITSDDVVVAISQSGETADTLAALELAKSAGALVIGVCNVVGSSIARFTDAGVYTHAGPEISVASTKAFTAQVTVLTAMALRLAQINDHIKKDVVSQIRDQLLEIPGFVEQILKNTTQYEAIAKDLRDVRDVLYIGRGLSFPVALEGALKLKEISYIHAEGYAAGEMKHGPIALIDTDTPTIIIAPGDRHKDKTLSNLQEIKARQGRVLVVTNQADTSLKQQADWLIEVPPTHEVLTPLLTCIPIQLLAYYIARQKGCEIDQPRNLAKSVTVE